MTSLVFKTVSTDPNEQAFELSGDINLDEIASVRDLISAKVRLQVENINALMDEEGRLTDEEFVSRLKKNGFLRPRASLKAKLSAEREIEKALEFFKSGEVAIFINGVQRLELDESLRIVGPELIVFLRLVPLIGG
jgi:hypothetical protein